MKNLRSKNFLFVNIVFLFCVKVFAQQVSSIQVDDMSKASGVPNLVQTMEDIQRAIAAKKGYDAGKKTYTLATNKKEREQQMKRFKNLSKPSKLKSEFINFVDKGRNYKNAVISWINRVTKHIAKISDKIAGKINLWNTTLPHLKSTYKGFKRINQDRKEIWDDWYKDNWENFIDIDRKWDRRFQGNIGEHMKSGKIFYQYFSSSAEEYGKWGTLVDNILVFPSILKWKGVGGENDIPLTLLGSSTPKFTTLRINRTDKKCAIASDKIMDKGINWYVTYPQYACSSATVAIIMAKAISDIGKKPHKTVLGKSVEEVQVSRIERKLKNKRLSYADAMELAGMIQTERLLVRNQTVKANQIYSLQTANYVRLKMMGEEVRVEEKGRKNETLCLLGTEGKETERTISINYEAWKKRAIKAGMFY